MTEKIDSINNLLKLFKIGAKCIQHQKLRNVSSYDLVLDAGGQVKEIYKYSNELSLCLKSKSPVSIQTITEQGIIRIEVVEDYPNVSKLFDVLPQIDNKSIYLGEANDGSKIEFDMKENPHILVAGTTGSGKSTLLHAFIANIVKNKDELYIIDTKNVEFSDYKAFATIATDYRSAVRMISDLYETMERRYKNKFQSSMHSIYLVIDEFADLILQDTNKQLGKLFILLLQKCRAANIFCICATQRPSYDILKGSIKANFPARISCKVASSTDAKVIGIPGAENLLRYNAIINNYKFAYKTFQVAYTNSDEIKSNYKTSLFNFFS